MNKHISKLLLSAGALLTFTSQAFAIDNAATGINGAFNPLYTDFSGAIAGGLGGFLVIIAIIYGGGSMIAGRPGAALWGFGAALLIGSGTAVFLSTAGVTADLDMLAALSPELLETVAPASDSTTLLPLTLVQ